MAAERRWDVVVVGGSYAGLALARSLSAELAVCGVERQSRTGKSLGTTGSTFTLPSGDLFTDFGVDPALAVARYRSLRVTSPHATYRADFQHLGWTLLDTEGLLRQLHADQPGVPWTFGTVAEAIEPRPWGSIVRARTPEGTVELRARLVVDATGANGRLTSGVARPKYTAHCAQADFTFDEPVDREQIELHPGAEESPAGYGYAFPMDRHTVRVGVCTTAKSFEPVTALHRFARRRFGDCLATRNAFHRQAVAGGRVTKLFDGRVLALGDRAGHLSPVMGEGIRFALLAARLAAPLIEDWLDGDEGAFTRFEPAWRRRLGRRYTVALLAQRLLSHCGAAGFDFAVERVAAAARHDPDLWLRILSTTWEPRDLWSLLRSNLLGSNLLRSSSLGSRPAHGRPGPTGAVATLPSLLSPEYSPGSSPHSIAAPDVGPGLASTTAPATFAVHAKPPSRHRGDET